MKMLLPLLLLASLPVTSVPGAEPASPQANTVVLDEAGVANLRIQTATVEARDFEETVFALGRIEVYPGRRAVLSSRIAGRALDVRIKHDHAVAEGDVAVVIESRQAGNPPPSISLAAPISGLVSVLSVVPGEPISPDRVLAEIVDLNEVYAVARVPEHLASRLKKGRSALITVAAAAGGVFPATLEHLGVNADPENGSVEAAFHVENPGLVLRPGMRAEFSIVVEQFQNVTSIPLSALQGTPADRFVYVKDFDLPHAFTKVPVVVGRTNERFVEIVRGLLPADEVVTQGAYALAFAGTGSLSLKEALDAAHGHAHNADGSEITSDSHESASDDHEHEGEGPFWKIVSGVLFLALLITGFWRKPAAV
jgi:cobalt-zinc-cadmium efflux system membrane fusion protein